MTCHFYSKPLSKIDIIYQTSRILDEIPMFVIYHSTTISYRKFEHCNTSILYIKKDLVVYIHFGDPSCKCVWFDFLERILLEEFFASRIITPCIFECSRQCCSCLYFSCVRLIMVSHVFTSISQINTFQL